MVDLSILIGLLGFKAYVLVTCRRSTKKQTLYPPRDTVGRYPGTTTVHM